MKLLHSTALAAALMAIAVPSLTSPAHAWRVGGWRGAGLGWRGAGWGWRGAGLGLAAAAVGTAAAASSYSGYGYGYPYYGYGYGTGYGYPAYGYGYGTGYGYGSGTATPPTLTLRPIATVMGPATATRLIAVTDTAITRLPAAPSMPPLWASGVTGANEGPPSSLW
jgi:hypothetical protein